MAVERCAVTGCASPRRKRAWCGKHYARWRRTGDPITSPKWNPSRLGVCFGCGSRDLMAGSLRYCSYACAQMVHRHGFDRPTERPCAHCGVAIDLTERTTNGRIKRADTKICFHCRTITRSPRSVTWLARRDGLACGICGEDVDMTLRAPELTRPSVDHIVPRAHGGTNDDSNLQLAHLQCNQVKQARVPSVGRNGGTPWQ